jgi:hypothetical protein
VFSEGQRVKVKNPEGPGWIPAEFREVTLSLAQTGVSVHPPRGRVGSTDARLCGEWDHRRYGRSSRRFSPRGRRRLGDCTSPPPEDQRDGLSPCLRTSGRPASRIALSRPPRRDGSLSPTRSTAVGERGCLAGRAQRFVRRLGARRSSATRAGSLRAKWVIWTGRGSLCCPSTPLACPPEQGRSSL